MATMRNIDSFKVAKNSNQEDPRRTISSGRGSGELKLSMSTIRTDGRFADVQVKVRENE